MMIFTLMNYREDLEIKLQKIILAIQEVNEDSHITDREKRKILSKLVHFKKAIIYKSMQLHIDLKVA